MEIRESNLKDIAEILELKNENKFNTDGWFIMDDDNKIYKIKPEYHMTDLPDHIMDNGFCDNNHPIYNEAGNLNSIINNWINISKNNIFKCYQENNKWIAKIRVMTKCEQIL